MEKIMDGILLAVSAALISTAGNYTLQKIANWSKQVALDKAAKGPGKLEPATQKMTGGKLDY